MLQILSQISGGRLERLGSFGLLGEMVAAGVLIIASASWIAVFRLSEESFDTDDTLLVAFGRWMRGGYMIKRLVKRRDIGSKVDRKGQDIQTRQVRLWNCSYETVLSVGQ